MGADGGSLAKRSDIVSRPSPRPAADAKASSDIWTHCALSGERLDDPVVSDWGGYLYNKKAVLEFLLGAATFSTLPKTNIRQIRDIAEIAREKSGDRWIDPISRKDIALEGLSQPLAYIVECGHVGPYRMLVDSRSQCCQVCEQHYSDVVILNPQSADAKARNKQRIEKLDQCGLSHSLRPHKKRTQKRQASSVDDHHDDHHDAKILRTR